MPDQVTLRIDCDVENMDLDEVMRIFNAEFWKVFLEYCESEVARKIWGEGKEQPIGILTDA